MSGRSAASRLLPAATGCSSPDGELAVEHADVEVAGAEVRVGEEGVEEGSGGADPLDAQLGEGALQAVERVLAVGRPDDQLGQHRVVVDGDLRRPRRRRRPPARRGRRASGAARSCPARARSAARGPRRRGAPRRRGRAAGRRRTRGRAARPSATRICACTRSRPVTSSVTGCSTCRRVFISRK